MVRVTIDQSECISCGNCYYNYPEFFEENPDDSLAQVVEKYRVEGKLNEGDAPEDMRNNLQGAADECPVEIIHVG